MGQLSFTSASRTHKVIRQAQDIVRWVLDHPRLFTTFRDVVYGCTGRDRQILQSIIDTSSAEPVAANHLGQLLTAYYELLDKPIDMMRSILHEEFVAALNPEYLNPNAETSYAIFQEAKLMYNNILQCVNPGADTSKNIDIVFQGETSHVGIQCKINLYNFLTRGGQLTEEATSTMEYLKCVKKRVGDEGQQISMSFSCLDTGWRLDRAKQSLAGGFIGVITSEDIIKIISYK